MMSIEHTMQEAHRGVRERLGLSVTTKPVRVVLKPVEPVPEPVTKPTPVQTYWSLPAFSVAVCQIGVDENPVSEESNYTINSRWREIVRQVCVKHGVTPMDIRSRHRERRLVAARHEAFYRLRTETTLSYERIGLKMGGFDHTSCYHGYLKHKTKLEDGTAI